MVRPSDIDAHLSRVPDEDNAEVIDDGLLLAYRAGTLTDDAKADVETLLAKSAEARMLLEALAEPIAPQNVNAARSVAPRSFRRTFRRTVLALATASAAAVAIIVLASGPKPPEYVLDAPQGFIKTQRSGTDPGPSTELSGALEPTSLLTLRLRPKTKVDDRFVLRLFSSKSSGPLTLVSPERIEHRHGAFKVQVDGRTLFGKTPGSHVVVVAIGQTKEALEGIAGHSVQEARKHSDAFGWWTLKVDYRANAP